ncbi:neutral/alkaline non-lysosomal ceramidase N-terminal domain-containing protein [Dyadobacter fanqingshengii]|uniref:Neutral/alkaline non-lysosomal ceramidase N-terminal domain-containing protein n=1 Tax=Dyadobacter fanqingshengii TaxID=2906443 RepID=A0A9X1TEZ1_9BACT|nr:neutral/alkaline non-lysosomal ceramidase N-terminal domain-containing protein [Dyadobacter fanqingshengii]MCF0038992.1 neutral/alkaline non-lysosomal ceramidase N-terminal domain-containing protein [Dyadobacter fanqingshengii]USJ34186.1 neutral/alkaline non-lysosomal ceramidase N-terminal domain-containing protein [Dyadobacter fanqingshengii]
MRLLIFSLLIVSQFPVFGQNKGWKAGVARAVITPENSMWMAGFAARTKPSDGKLHDLWAKALALEDANGKRAVLITTDLLGMPKNMSDEIRKRVNDQFKLSKAQIIINSSHTHSGPVLGDALSDIYPVDAAEKQSISQYSQKLIDQLVILTGNALKSLQPATIQSQNGVARFQVNRRNNDAANLERLTEITGPGDAAVPVLKVADANGKIMAIAFGYACHPTVLDNYQWSGDYPGYAQIELEKLYPGTTALFFQGAGADQNPLPRRTIPLAIQYGKTLAAAVERVLSEDMKILEPTLTTAYTEIDLALTTAPTKENLTKMAEKAEGYQKKWALRMLDKANKGEAFQSSYPFPLQVWKLGDQAIMTLGGELVVSYAISLKQIFGQDTFVMGYSNDVMTYIPSTTILREGGYEGEVAQIVYGLPATWASDAEIQIISNMVKLAKEAGIVKPESRLIKN